jgi:hypothetical protein
MKTRIFFVPFVQKAAAMMDALLVDGLPTGTDARACILPCYRKLPPMDPKRISSAQTTGHEPLVDEKGIPYGPRRACCAKLASTYFPKWTSFVDGRSFD